MRPDEERVSSTSNKTDYVCNNCWLELKDRYPDNMRREYFKGGKNEIQCPRCGGELIRIPFRMKDDMSKRWLVDPRPSLKTPPKPLDKIKYKGWKQSQKVKELEESLNS